MKEYLSAWKKYFQFRGRSRRREFWMFFLFNVLISILLELIDLILGTRIGAEEPILSGDYFEDVLITYEASGVGILGSIYSFLIIIPSLAITVRRLHDINRTGLWLLTYVVLFFLVFVGLLFIILHWPGGDLLIDSSYVLIILFSILLLVWNCQNGTKGSNKYGADPKI